MEERPLNFEVNEDETIVKVEDKKEVMKVAVDLYSIVGMLHKQIKEDRTEKGFLETALSLIEHGAADLLTSLGYESIQKKDLEKRYAEIKAVNKENHELRRQLGEKVSAEDIREFLKTASMNLYDWGKKSSLGYVKERSFGSYGVICELSPAGGFIETEDINVLRRKGFELKKESKYHYNMVGSKENINLIDEMLKDKFPSGEILDVDLRSSDKRGLEINRIKFRITNYDDLMSLNKELKNE